MAGRSGKNTAPVTAEGIREALAELAKSEQMTGSLKSSEDGQPLFSFYRNVAQNEVKKTRDKAEKYLRSHITELAELSVTALESFWLDWKTDPPDKECQALVAIRRTGSTRAGDIEAIRTDEYKNGNWQRFGRKGNKSAYSVEAWTPLTEVEKDVKKYLTALEQGHCILKSE